MSVKDWELRALPSKERCERWHENGGQWHYTSTLDVNGVCVTTILTPDAFPRSAMVTSFRPWKDGNPVTWSEFYAATHPPIPEGWEKVGEWEYGSMGGAFKGCDRIMLEGGAFATEPIYGDRWFVRVRRVTPPITWADVPDNTRLTPTESRNGFSVYKPDGIHVGWVIYSTHTGLWTPNNGQNGTPRDLPAAIVHLTGKKS